MVAVQSAGKGRNSIRLRWRYGGKRYSFCIPGDTASSRALARQRAAQIDLDILNNDFDVTLTRYRVEGKRIVKPADTTADLFVHWVSVYRNADLESTSYYRATHQMLKRWQEAGVTDEASFPHMLMNEQYSPATYNDRLNCLGRFCDWLVKTGRLKSNPLDEVQRRRKVSKVFQQTTRSPISSEDIETILNAIKDDTFCPTASRYSHSHYYPFLYFLFSTGVRPGEAIGLRCGSVTKDGCVRIHEALARTCHGTHAGARIRKKTKTGTERTIIMADALRQVVLPLLQDRKPDDLVFTSPHGLAIDDRMLQRRILKPVLKALGMESKDLYAARHSFGTRAVYQGVPLPDVAYMMGHSSVETTVRNYIGNKGTPLVLPSL